MTRMWLVDPELLCDRHLLGEHNELHKLQGHIEKGNIAVVRGHAEKGQVDTSKIEERHDELAEEMERRGFDHQSPLDYEDELEVGSIDVEENRKELEERCEECRERIRSRG
ncbi:MAG: pyrimidine dimer DNA glycosylase/endonuclease V [Candidatus Nanohaloarchaea archaeon]|nr:pyrimidine dimer DNA glycosylase/endonuclease V [Candidatus Nanohaloarchaea archaeon]